MRARVITFVLFGLATSALPMPAWADEPTANADADPKERSRTAFRKGVAQLRAQEWAAARASFEAAWALFPHPSILLNLGIARLRTDDPVHAEQDLMRFLSEDVGASADELASAREALADARTKLGTLKIVVTPAAARVSVDGKAVDTVRRSDGGAALVVAEVRVKAGRHAIAVDADGYVAHRRDLDVVPKGEADLLVTLVANDAKDKGAKPMEGTQTRTIVGWSLAGLGGAALITSAVAAVRAKGLADDYSDPAHDDYQSRDVRSEGVAFRTTADIALLVALTSGTAAVILLLTDIGKGSTDVARAGGVLRW